MEPPPKWPLIFLHLGFHTFSGEPSPLSKSRSSSMSPALPMITTQSYFGKIVGTSFWKNGTSVEKTSGKTEKKNITIFVCVFCAFKPEIGNVQTRNGLIRGNFYRKLLALPTIQSHSKKRRSQMDKPASQLVIRPRKDGEKLQFITTFS